MPPHTKSLDPPDDIVDLAPPDGLVNLAPRLRAEFGPPDGVVTTQDENSRL